MFSKEKRSIVKATKEGRLYIETEDFFRQPKIIETIEFLLQSDIVKSIDEYNRARNEKAQKH